MSLPCSAMVSPTLMPVMPAMAAMLPAGILSTMTRSAAMDM